LLVLITQLFLVCFLCMNILAVPAFVSHVGFVFEDGSVIFYKGHEDGVRPGDVFEVVRQGERVGILKATEVQPFYTRASVLTSAGPVKESDLIQKIEPGEVPLVPKVKQLEPGAAEIPVEGTAPGVGGKEMLEKIPSAGEPGMEQHTGDEPIEHVGPEDRDEPEGMVVRDKEMEDRFKKGKLTLDLKGYRYFKYRTYNASGAYENFLSRNGLITYGNAYEQGTQLTVTMKYGESVEVKGEFFELPYQERTLNFGLKAGKYTAEFGDFSASFRSGSLATIDKSITGTHVQYTTDKVKADYLISHSKSESSSVSFTGDNTYGPFSLDAYEIVEGSEKVRINGQAVSRDEYEIDYYLGQITFCSEGEIADCRQIKSSDKVQVEFEEKLVMDSKGGNVMGVSASYQGSELIDIGVAHVIEEANRSADRIKQSASLTVTGEEIQQQQDCPADTICLPSTYDRTELDYTMMVKNFEKVYKNGNVYTGYNLDADGYARGQIELTEPFTASDSFKIDYSFYIDDYINAVTQDDSSGKIRGTDGAETFFILPKATIYEGTEVVFLCRGDVEEPCDFTQTLERGTDYKIYEENNAIEVDAAYAPNDSLDRFLHVTYLYVPTTSARESAYDHTVSQVFGKTSLGPVDLQFEFGQSESDISSTPVQILQEKVTVAGNTFKCESGTAPPRECVFQLDNSNIVELSESVYLDTTDRPLYRGSGYDLDYETGELMLKDGIELSTGTVLFADYQYNPDVPEGLVTGKASRLKANTSFRGFNLNMQLDNTDAFFSPLGGNNTLEISRADWGVSGPLAKGVMISYNNSTFDIAKDIYESSIVTNNSSDYSVNYSSDIGYQLEYSAGTEEAVDNLDNHKTNETRDENFIKLGYEGLLVPTLDVAYEKSESDFSDLTGNANNTTSESDGINVAYSRGENLELELKMENIVVEGSGVTESFTTTTETRNYIVSYKPFELITLDADINHQGKSDSRPEVGASGKDQSTLRITSGSFGKVRNASLSFINQSFPSHNAGTTNTKTIFLTFSYAITSALTATPSTNRTSTDSPQSTAENNLNTLKLDYRPQDKKYSTTLSTEFGDTTSSSSSGDSSSGTSRRLSWDLLYDFNEKTKFVYRFSDQESSFSSGGSNLTTTHSYNIGYEPSEGKTFKLKYTNTARSSSSSSTDDQSYQLESDLKLSEIFRWVTTAKMMSFSNSKSPDSDYSGSLVETELRAEF